jgi:hypothetical protein
VLWKSGDLGLASGPKSDRIRFASRSIFAVDDLLGGLCATLQFPNESLGPQSRCAEVTEILPPIEETIHEEVGLEDLLRRCTVLGSIDSE